MHSEKVKASSKDLHSHKHPRPSANKPKRSVKFTPQVHPEPSAHTEPSERPPGPLDQKPAEQVSPGESEKAVISDSEKEAIQKRAEGRTRVPPRFRDGFKPFFFSPTGALKVLRLGFLIGSLACFIITEAYDSYIVITLLETCIVLFFILIYMLTLHRLLTFIDWPLLDLINSFITTAYLLIVAVLAMQEKERRHLFYVGWSLCLTAAIVCIIDAIVVTRKMRNNMKKVLGIEVETSSSPAPAESAQKASPESTKAPEEAPAKAPTKVPTSSSSRAPSVASTAALLRAPSRAKEGAPPPPPLPALSSHAVTHFGSPVIIKSGLLSQGHLFPHIALYQS